MEIVLLFFLKKWRHDQGKIGRALRTHTEPETAPDGKECLHLRSQVHREDLCCVAMVCSCDTINHPTGQWAVKNKVSATVRLASPVAPDRWKRKMWAPNSQLYLLLLLHKHTHS